MAKRKLNPALKKWLKASKKAREELYKCYPKSRGKFIPLKKDCSGMQDNEVKMFSEILYLKTKNYYDAMK